MLLIWVLFKNKMPPYWNITSSIDWCEENYIYSNYIAEFWNTISSFCMVFSGIYLHFKQKRSPSIQRLHTKCITSLTLVNTGMVFIGVGSILFHMILSRYSQALDEIPMIWTALLLIYLSTNELIKLTWLGALIKSIFFIVYGIFATLSITLVTGDLQFTLFHTNNTIISVLVLVCFGILSKRLDEFHEFKKSAMYFGIAVGCWGTDLMLCQFVSYIQLHAIWHLFSSVGFYYLIKILEMSLVYNYKNSIKKIV